MIMSKGGMTKSCGMFLSMFKETPTIIHIIHVIGSISISSKLIIPLFHIYANICHHFIFILSIFTVIRKKDSVFI